MPSYNKVILVGHVTRDPQTKHLQNNVTVAEFGIAVNHKFKGRDGNDREEVLFIDCTSFGKGAEIIGQYVQKGKALLVEGRLKLDSWDDKQTGTKRYKHSVIVDNFQFLGGTEGGAGGQESARRQPPQSQSGGRPKQAEPGGPPFGDEQQFDEADIPF